VNAEAMHAALSRLKSHPVCMRNWKVVIEYVGSDIDAALAI
jgi:hypothetical protein